MFQKSKTVGLVVAIAVFLALIGTSATSQAGSDGLATGKGKVNMILSAERKVNITHGPVADLGWPGMTMDFRLADEVSLDGIEAGSEVTFQLRKTADGGYEIVSMALSHD